MKKFTMRQLRRINNLSLESASKEIGISREHLGRIETDLEALHSVRLETILSAVKVYGAKIDEVNFFEL